MLKRAEYLVIIEEIRNIEKVSIDEYIETVLEPLRKENSYFLETLYKDINYLLNDIDKKDENDFEISKGDFVIEENPLFGGDINLKGYQSRLHNISIYLHTEISKQFTIENPLEYYAKMESFENNFLKKTNYTTEYKSALDLIKKSIKKERKLNLGERESLWEKICDLDNIEIKPKIFGFAFNGNYFFNKFRKK